MEKILFAVVIAVGSISADTLTLRDGTQIDGTLVRATGKSVTFIDSRGDRRNYRVADIEELAFGDSSSSRSRTESDGVDLVSRLNEDIGTALDRSTLSDKQRQILEDARAVLSKAAEDLRDNRNVKTREVRKALDNVRYVMNGSGVRAQDRRAVLDDIQQLRNEYPEFGSRSR